MDVPETKYAKTIDGVHIAYQVVGDGPVDMYSTSSPGSPTPSTAGRTRARNGSL